MKTVLSIVTALLFVVSTSVLADDDNGYDDYDDEPESSITIINEGGEGGQGGEGGYAQGGEGGYAEGGNAEATAGVEGSGNGTAAINLHIGGDKIRPRSSAPDLTSGPNCTGSASGGVGGVLSVGGTKETAGCAAWRNVREMAKTEDRFGWTDNSYNAVLCGYGKMKVALAWAEVDCKAVLAGPQKLKDQRLQEADESTWDAS